MSDLNDLPITCIKITNTENEETKMNKYQVSAVLSIMHTDIIEANSLEEAEAIVREWSAEDFTEDDECGRSWDIDIMEA